MQRWRVVLGFVWLAWHVSGLAFHHLLARHYAREILITLPMQSPESVPLLLSQTVVSSYPGQPKLLSERCSAAFNYVSFVSSALTVGGGLYVPNVYHIKTYQSLSAYCPSGTRRLPPDLALAEQLIPPEVLSLFAGVIETLEVQSRPGAPPTEPLLRKLVIGLVHQHQRSSMDWPTKTESQGLPADSVQLMAEAARACRFEVPDPTEELGDYYRGHRAEIFWHPETEPFVPREDWMERFCLLDAAKQVPPPDGLARLIWIGEG